MNELVEHKSWWKKNWKWLIPFMIIGFIGIIGISTSKVGEGITHIAKAYSDASIYENAFEKAKKNTQVKELLGELKPIDNMAIIEGSVIYSNDNNKVDIGVRVIGSKGKGKMDVSAIRNGANWDYTKINIRMKKPKQTIKILEF